VKAETVVVKAGLECKLVPAPRHLSYDCGVALQFQIVDRERVGSALDDGGVEYECIADPE
jgi:hypothetical protein